MLTRRQFLKLSAAAGASLALSGKFAFDAPVAQAFYQSTALQKFVQPLRGVGPGGIPVALPDGTTAPVTGAVHYTFKIGQYQDTLHPYLGGKTTLWGYSPSAALGEGPYPTRHLGGIVVAQKGVPIQLTFTNNLPPAHILPVDVSDFPMAVGGFPDAQAKFGGNGYNAATTHLHGGFVPWISDGGPLSWFTPAASGGKYGPGIANATSNFYKLLNPGLAAGQAEYYYPNAQSARMMWYHDHAHDITRLNAYAGIASAYIIRDSFEGNLRNVGLPDFVENGGREIPLVIQDKIFVGPNIAALDPTWKGPNTPGSLWYPHVYERNRWKSAGGGNTPPIPDPSCIPEMFGDTMLANGTVYPEATVEARRYRLRVLNACQARFLNLQLYVDDGSADGITLNAALNPTNAKGPDFLVIGTEGGFLSKPVQVASNQPFNPATMKGSLVTGPAERWDIIVDFKGFAGKKVILYNDAPAPFPMGSPLNDYFPGAPKNPTITNPGFGPNTRQIMRFNVVSATSGDPPLAIPFDLTPGIDPSLVGMWTTTPLPPPPGAPVRTLTLNEDYDSWGRLVQRLGTNVQPTKFNTFGRNYMDASTENPKAGATEVWQIVNTTADAHPMHFHLVNVQVLQRQPYNSFGPTTGPAMPNYNGPATGPDPLELGWKETVKMYPGTVTTVIMRFDLPANPPGIATMPNSLNPNLGVSGKEYVWHCHILDHEEHDMMRPLVVT
ncbi:MAG TPA: multicopper oxidase domain-containing protein [Anaerolineales bacterium]